jgi:hypothetical protein
MFLVLFMALLVEEVELVVEHQTQVVSLPELL